eukprot:4559221-Amphidinium_carterae.1
MVAQKAYQKQDTGHNSCHEKPSANLSCITGMSAVDDTDIHPGAIPGHSQHPMMSVDPSIATSMSGHQIGVDENEPSGVNSIDLSSGAPPRNFSFQL